MIKKTMTYTDYNGIVRTEDFYFNLTKAELLNMEWGTSGGMTNIIPQIVNAKDIPSIASLFEKIIQKAYGKKSPDGRRFIKNQEVLDDFMQTEAYSDLYMELATDADKATEFIKGVMPADMQSIDVESVKGEVVSGNVFPLPQEVTNR